MKCPYCGDEMIRGYLMSSRDITFAVELGADAVIDVKYGSSQVMQGAAEVIAYGPAVKIIEK